MYRYVITKTQQLLKPFGSARTCAAQFNIASQVPLACDKDRSHVELCKSLSARLPAKGLGELSQQSLGEAG